MNHSDNSDNQIAILESAQITCEDVEATLGDLVEGEMIPTLQARVVAHIHKCETCQQMEREYRKVVELAAEMKDPPIPAGVRTRLHDALSRRTGVRF